MYSRILVPLDGSPLAEQVLPFLYPLVQSLQCPVTLLRAFNVPVLIAEGTQRIRVEALEYLDRVGASLAGLGVTISTVTQEGEPASLIIKEAEQDTSILIAMTTGARAGAILGLTWGRVDMERGRIDFVDPERAETKKRRAVVPVGVPVITALRDARQYAQTPFVIEYMGKPVASITTAFRRAARDSGVRPVPTPHLLKHSVVSWLAEAGRPLDEIADLTATNRATVLRIYRKFSPEYLRGVADYLSNLPGLANAFAKPRPVAASQKARNPKVSQGVPVVGAAGIEPATPTIPTYLTASSE